MKEVFKLKEGFGMGKLQYRTKQMTELLTFLESVQGRHVTVNEICDALAQKGIAIGTTTVYRHLERLVEDGTVAKYVVDGTSSACFEYMGEHSRKNQEPCYHCKCEKCGRLIHLHCEEVEKLRQHMIKDHGFEVDPFRIVFYGICEKCRNEKFV